MNIEALKINLKEINQIEKAFFFDDGQQVINEVKEILSKPQILQRPIQALLLDFQMPIKTGIQVVQEVKELFKAH